MSDQVEDERHPAGVVESDFGKQSSLKASPIRQGGIFVEEIAVLLSWQRLEGERPHAHISY